VGNRDLNFAGPQLRIACAKAVAPVAKSR
jgi:hypothetical protein